MDRLICGDVGFGKTEIAIRAAFKAVTDSKQVAVLVPTTILALQHYRTFNDRLKEFPVRIEHLSRVKSAKEVRQIADDLAAGKIDILVGTHKTARQKHRIQGSGPADYRRRTKIRRSGQRETAPPESQHRHADDDGHPDPAYAAILVDGFARLVGHFNAAAEPPADRHREPPVRRGRSSAKRSDTSSPATGRSISSTTASRRSATSNAS